MKSITVVLLVIGIFVGNIGCLVDSSVPVVQPVLEQSTTGTVQYDYKAGAPGMYNVANGNDTTGVNPYLIPTYYGIADNFTWTRVVPRIRAIPYYGSWGWAGSYYNPVPIDLVPVRTGFWTGSAVVTVQ